MEGAEIAEKFSKDAGLRCRQFGLKFMQYFLSASLAVHMGLERYEVTHIHEQFIIFC